MNFVVSVIHEVSDLSSAAKLLCEILGFAQKSVCDDAVVVENGAIVVRLTQAKSKSAVVNPLVLEVHTQNMTQSISELTSKGDIRLIEQTTHSSRPERLEVFLQGPHNISICLAQEFNEDQLGILPPLPTSLIWDDEAELCVRQMLRLVPISFRHSARIRVTEQAEMFAGRKASVTVSLDTALCALVETTPLFQHLELRAALETKGIDTDKYFPKEKS